ncbi:MAG: hypothetical protein KatS3mg001_572 [Candidatus Pacearchaeota archaeon]|nr:MAG: hypothetical protein KatS3mg001_572 [Candidatus Pacearchaeota archaeon]
MNEDYPQTNNEFYSLILKFRKDHIGKKRVYLIVRKSKKGKPLKKVLEFPSYFDEREIYWKSFQGEYISVYHKIGSYKYINTTHPENTLVSISLAQKLEKIVYEAKLNKKF